MAGDFHVATGSPDSGLTIRFFDREFNSAIEQLAAVSSRTDVEVLTGQARRLLRFMTNVLTPLAQVIGRFFRNTGRARAGWWESWRGLNMFGIPRGTNPRVLGRGEGTFADGRHHKNRPFVVLANEVPYIDKLDAEHHIIDRGTMGRLFDMTRELERRYAQNMRRHSG